LVLVLSFYCWWWHGEDEAGSWPGTSHVLMVKVLQLVRQEDLAAKHGPHLLLFQLRSRLHSPYKLQ